MAMIGQSDIYRLPLCEFLVNVRECPNESTHIGFRATHFVVSLLAVLFCLSTLAVRLAKLRHASINSLVVLLMGTGALVNAVHSAMMLFGGYTHDNYVQRYIGQYFAVMLVQVAAVLFLYSLVDSVLQDRSIKWSFVLLVVVQCTGLGPLLLAFSLLAGVNMDINGIWAITAGVTGFFVTLGLLDVGLAVAYFYYCGLVIRHNEETASKSEGWSTVRQIKLLGSIGLSLFGTLFFFYGIFRQQIQQSTGWAVVFELVFLDCSIILAIINAALFYWEFSGKLDGMLAFSPSSSNADSSAHVPTTTHNNNLYVSISDPATPVESDEL